MSETSISEQVHEWHHEPPWYRKHTPDRKSPEQVNDEIAHRREMARINSRLAELETRIPTARASETPPKDSRESRESRERLHVTAPRVGAFRARTLQEACDRLVRLGVDPRSATVTPVTLGDDGRDLPGPDGLVFWGHERVTPLERAARISEARRVDRALARRCAQLADHDAVQHAAREAQGAAREAARLELAALALAAQAELRARQECREAHRLAGLTQVAPPIAGPVDPRPASFGGVLRDARAALRLLRSADTQDDGAVAQAAYDALRDAARRYGREHPSRSRDAEALRLVERARQLTSREPEVAAAWGAVRTAAERVIRHRWDLFDAAVRA